MVKRIILILAFVISLVPTMKAQSEVGLMNLTDGPVFIGDIKEFIQENVQYPATAKCDSIEGRVVVRFLIDSLGITKNHRIIKSVRKDLDNEALRVARLIKFDSPAMQYDKIVRIEYSIPVDFVLRSGESIGTGEDREGRGSSIDRKTNIKYDGTRKKSCNQNR